MIVELVGLPGSGKTTLAKRLASEGRFALVRIEGRSELFYYNLLFLLLHPLSFARGFAWLLKYRGKRARWYLKLVNLFFVHNAKYMKARKFSHAIIDQGHHQNIISLFDQEVLPEVIEQYIRILPKPDLLCFVLADSETRGRRLALRGYGVRENEAGEDRRAWIGASEKNFEQLYLSRNDQPCFVETVSPEDVEQKMRKLNTKNPWYFIMHARMPTEKAHGVQIAKTLEALSREGEYAALWVPSRREIKQRVADFYGLSALFPVRYFHVPQFLRLSKVLGSLAFWLDAAGFLLALAFARLPREAICFTRHAEIAWLLAKRGRRVFYEAHLFPSSKRAAFAWLLKGVTGVIANSAGTASAFQNAGFSHVHVIRNGVDLLRFESPPSRDELCEKLQLPKDKTIVMYVGAFYAWKGVPAIAEMWKKHFANDERKALVLVGGTPNELEEEFRDLPGMQIVPHVQFQGIATYMRAADILLLPNVPLTEEAIRYTSPIKLFEYMASGRPIIASDLPSIREIVSDEMVLFAKAGDGDDIATKISTLAADRALGEKLAHAARREVRQYDWKERAKKLCIIAKNG